MAILAAGGTENNRTGNGRYTPLKRRKKQNEEENQENQQGQSDVLEQKDRRMRFKNSKDPVYVAFDYLDKQPLKKLALEFVKDSITDIMFFVSKFN